MGSGDYWLFLLCGLPAWVFFATAAQASSRSLLENANLIRKVRFPRQLVPLSIVATHLVGFAVMLVVVVVLSLFKLPEARDTVWLAFPLGALFACMVAGVALAIASLNALFRDVEHLLTALLLPWFFLTPILYSLDQLPGDRLPGGRVRDPLGELPHAAHRGDAGRALLRRAARALGDDLLGVAAVVALAAGVVRLQPLGRPDRRRSLTTARPSKSASAPENDGRPVVGLRLEPVEE